jgi:hypothetical protein
MLIALDHQADSGSANQWICRQLPRHCIRFTASLEIGDCAEKTPKGYTQSVPVDTFPQMSAKGSMVCARLQHRLDGNQQNMRPVGGNSATSSELIPQRSSTKKSKGSPS